MIKEINPTPCAYINESERHVIMPGMKERDLSQHPAASCRSLSRMILATLTRCIVHCRTRARVHARYDADVKKRAARAKTYEEGRRMGCSHVMLLMASRWHQKDPPLSADACSGAVTATQPHDSLAILRHGRAINYGSIGGPMQA